MGDRAYPAAPRLAVGAIIPRADRVLLIQRGQAPAAGLWTLPGGGVEVGETVRAALVREVWEETGLAVTPGPLVEIFEVLEHDAAGGLRYHFVILDFLAECSESAPARAASDAVACAWVRWDEVGGYPLTTGLAGVLAKARGLAQPGRDAPGQSPLS
ncbi:MAG: NUDIX hydrolase [Terriglobales bacterium]